MDVRLSTARRLLDRRLDVQDLVARVGPRPERGWVWEIRTALGMSSYRLAARVGISPTRVREFEKAEVEGTIRLTNLSRLARALHCEVFYVLVPNETLERTTWRQAQRKAIRKLGGDRPVDPALGVTSFEEIAGVARLEELTELTLHYLDHRELWR